MTINTPAYRSDNIEGLDQELVEYLDATYFYHLKNVDLKNPKLIVLYSGGNGVGKSTLSALIQKELGALVIENDEVKKRIIEHIPGLARQDLIE